MAVVMNWERDDYEKVVRGSKALFVTCSKCICADETGLPAFSLVVVG